MIPSDRLQLAKFSEERSDGALETAKVRVEDVETTRTWTATATRTGDTVVLRRFNDSATTCFEREAFGALWYCIEEFHARDIYPDLGPFGHRAGHTAVDRDRRERSMTLQEATDTTTDAETPAADGEAPQPTAALSDGGATPAIRDAPGVLEPVSTETWCDDDVKVGDDISDLVDEDDTDESTDEDTVEACPDCDGTTIYARKTKPADERWRCSGCSAVFSEPVIRPTKTGGSSPDDEEDEDTVELPDERPKWLAGSPTEIVDDSRVHTDLDRLVSAVILEPDVPNVARHLGRSTSTVRGELLQPLGLIDADGVLLDDDTLDERLDIITRWDDE